VKLIKSILLWMVYLVLLGITYSVYIRFFKVDVVFYSALYAVTLALVLFVPVLYFGPTSKSFSTLENVQHLVICGLLGYVLAISLPTVIDRSLSFYILEKLQQRGGGIQLAKLEQVFLSEYVREHQLMDIRLTEQLQSGTVAIEDGCVKLTARGHQLASFSRYFRQHFLPRQRLLRDEYTDALTNPFRRIQPVPDYLCQ
jgi:hypothetical protein